MKIKLKTDQPIAELTLFAIVEKNMCAYGLIVEENIVNPVCQFFSVSELAKLTSFDLAFLFYTFTGQNSMVQRIFIALFHVIEK